MTLEEEFMTDLNLAEFRRLSPEKKFNLNFPTTEELIKKNSNRIFIYSVGINGIYKITAKQYNQYKNKILNYKFD